MKTKPPLRNFLHGLVGLLAVAAAPALALTIASHDAGFASIDQRGVSASETTCTGYDQIGSVTICLNQTFARDSDFATPGDTAFQTRLSPNFAGSPMATHLSVINATSISGSGGITRGDITPGAVIIDSSSVQSLFFYGFTIDEDADFHLTALLERPEIFSIPGLGSGFARIMLCQYNQFGCSSTTSIVSEVFVRGPELTIAIDETGRLTAGAYLLRVEAGDQGGRSEASWDFDLSLTQLPEPSSVYLVLGALGMLGAARRRA